MPSGVLPRVLSRVLFLLVSAESTLESTLKEKSGNQNLFLVILTSFTYEIYRANKGKKGQNDQKNQKDARNPNPPHTRKKKKQISDKIWPQLLKNKRKLSSTRCSATMLNKTTFSCVVNLHFSSLSLRCRFVALLPRTPCVGRWLEAVLLTQGCRSEPEGFVPSWDMAGTMMMTHNMVLFAKNRHFS